MIGKAQQRDVMALIDTQRATAEDDENLEEGKRRPAHESNQKP